MHHDKADDLAPESVSPVVAVSNLMVSLEDGLEQIDRALAAIDEGLNRSQPPIPGKLRIHWLSEGKGKPLYPTLVQWFVSTRKKVWFPKQLPWKGAGSRAKFVGGFGLNYLQTRALLNDAERLMRLRNEALVKRRTIQASLKALVARVDRQAEDAYHHALTLHAECQENLVLREG